MGATILIAEDEPELRAVFRDGLSPHYTVLTAAHGHEALKLLQENPEIALLLSDVRMPGMTGFELAELALSLNAELKVLFISAFQDEVPPVSLLRARAVRTLHKPFGLARLVSLVEEMLARP
jgi:CheY-like chemotaxis protein